MLRWSYYSYFHILTLPGLWREIVSTRIFGYLMSCLPWCLFGFITGGRTHDCFVQVLTPLQPATCPAFVAVKATFDVTQRDNIVDELAHLTVTRKFFTWGKRFPEASSSPLLFTFILVKVGCFSLSFREASCINHNF